MGVRPRWMAVPGLGVHSTVDGLRELLKLTDRLNVPPNPWQLLLGGPWPGAGDEWGVLGEGRDTVWAQGLQARENAETR